MTVHFFKIFVSLIFLVQSANSLGADFEIFYEDISVEEVEKVLNENKDQLLALPKHLPKSGFLEFKWTKNSCETLTFSVPQILSFVIKFDKSRLDFESKSEEVTPDHINHFYISEALKGAALQLTKYCKAGKKNKMNLDLYQEVFESLDQENDFLQNKAVQINHISASRTLKKILSLIEVIKTLETPLEVNSTH